MPTFDFISSDEYRKIIESDYRELSQALSNRSWKSAVMLAGCIAEALLVDYLVVIRYGIDSGVDPIKMTIDKVVAAIDKDRIPSSKALQLRDLIIMYRNLIHPLMPIRLKQLVSENDALTAGAVIDRLMDEISQDVRKAYGFTADHVVSILEQDRNAGGNIKSYIDALGERELERLITTAIPNRCATLLDSEDDLRDKNKMGLVLLLQKCYRMAYGVGSDTGRRHAAEAYADAVKASDEAKLRVYGNFLFNARDLQYLSKEMAGPLKKYLFVRMEKNPNRFFLDTLHNIWLYLEKEDIDEFVNICVTWIIYGTSQEIRLESKKWFLHHNWDEMNPDLKEQMLDSLQRWIDNYEFFNNKEDAKLVRELKMIAGSRQAA